MRRPIVSSPCLRSSAPDLPWMSIAPLLVRKGRPPEAKKSTLFDQGHLPLLLVHHHAFKCAGSSVAHILHRTWPQRVLHIEHARPDSRIHIGAVRPFVEAGDYAAVSSHLLTMPRPGEQIAPVHFGLVRDPLDRILSAYRFVQDRWAEGGFERFQHELEHQVASFQCRHLGVPTGDPGDDWHLDLDAVPLDSSHVLIGLVERFDDSMFLLERRLAALGCAFDGSHGHACNVGSGPLHELPADTLQQLRERNVEDYELVRRVGCALDAELEAVDPDGSGRAEFRARCRARAAIEEPYLVPDPSGWIYLED
jgi:hypothetical protein